MSCNFCFNLACLGLDITVDNEYKFLLLCENDIANFCFGKAGKCMLCNEIMYYTQRELQILQDWLIWFSNHDGCLA